MRDVFFPIQTTVLKDGLTKSGDPVLTGALSQDHLLFCAKPVKRLKFSVHEGFSIRAYHFYIFGIIMFIYK